MFFFGFFVFFDRLYIVHMNKSMVSRDHSIHNIYNLLTMSHKNIGRIRILAGNYWRCISNCFMFLYEINLKKILWDAKHFKNKAQCYLELVKNHSFIMEIWSKNLWISWIYFLNLIPIFLLIAKVPKWGFFCCDVEGSSVTLKKNIFHF